MSKVLIINGPASGHVNPTLGLTQELVSYGEEVYYLSSEEFRKSVEATGAVFQAYPNFLEQDDPFLTKYLLERVIKILSSYDIILPAVLSLAEEHSFDYFIHDWMYGCGNAVGKLLGIPHISLCTSFIKAERMMVDNPDARKDWKQNMLLVKQFAETAGKIEKSYGLDRITIEDVMFNPGHINLVFTSKYLQPEDSQLGDHYKFVGPSLSSRGGDHHFPLKLLEKETVIFISLGTMYNAYRPFYEICFEALASFPGRIVMAVGSRIDIGSFASIPDNFIVRSTVPQVEVLKHTDLFITHGGMNSVHEALLYHIPLIVVPMAADQPFVANRIEEIGAGVKLDRETLTSPHLRQKVEELLTESRYRDQSAIAGESLRTAGGSKRSLEEIIRFKEERGLY